MRMVRVKGFGGTVNYDGKKYGPSAGPLDIPEDLANALGLVGEEVEAAASLPEAVQEALGERDEARQDLAELTRLLRPRQLADETPDAVLRRVLQEGAASEVTLGDFRWLLAPEVHENESAHDALVRTLKDLGTYKGFADTSQGLLLRYVGETGADESGLDVIRRLTGELDRLRADGESNDVVRLRSELEAARRDAEDLRGKLATTDGEGGGALAQVATLSAEVERLRALPVLPADAHQRLVALPKIGDTLAEQVITALKAPPVAPADEQ